MLFYVDKMKNKFNLSVKKLFEFDLFGQPKTDYRLYDKGFGKARGRRLYCNTPTTDYAVQNRYLKAYRILSVQGGIFNE